ncbi:MAG: serine/threonine protein kinase [Myxococcales bacterium]|nr:serine/threonine protein kinase [Myxococcales bacterium]MCB9520078.1 serine/threonine protein kinase [Myxococcales bacterium]MCB9531804.1 serine/threonine protein kinase [Myxococcales bacterium]
MPPRRPKPKPQRIDPRTTLDASSLSVFETAGVREDVVLVDRYELGAEMGSGAHGQVYLARDLLTGRDVAVKMLRPRSSPSLLVGEVALLRTLDIPGVVHFIDDGEHNGLPFLVTELCDGAPFPGDGCDDWYELEERAIALLETLDRLHAAGLVHRDIKPHNVLVTGTGQPIVLDFGVALDLGAARTGPAYAGTPIYMTPELLEGGEEPSAATDLYAFGVMLAESITGALPFAASSLHELLEQKRAPRELQPRFPVPPRVLALVRELMGPEASARPATARSVLGRLVGAPSGAIALSQSADTAPASSPKELEHLFHGPELLLHLPSDAAQALFDRTNGEPRAVRAEIDAWVRAGLCRWVDDRIEIGRPAVDRLMFGLRVTPDGLRSAAQQPLEPALVEDRTRRATAARLEGRLREAAWLVDGARAVARVLDDDALALLVHRETVLVAIEQLSLQAVDLALYQLRDAPGAEGARLISLLRAARSVRDEDYGKRALDVLDALPPFDGDLELERARRALRVSAAKLEGPDAYAEEAEATLAWAEGTGEPALVGAVKSWIGHVHYQRGDYERCAELNEEAALTADRETTRVAALLNAAAARLELEQFARVVGLAHRAAEHAARLRHPYLELRARRLARNAQYRSEEPLDLDSDLLQAVVAVDAVEEVAAVLLNEAAVAWRRGQRREARSLALESADACRRSARLAGVEALASALATAAGAVMSGEEIARVCAAIPAHMLGVSQQVLALFRMAGHDVPVPLAGGRPLFAGLLLTPAELLAVATAPAGAVDPVTSATARAGA